jgi:hypothetical protein
LLYSRQGIGMRFSLDIINEYNMCVCSLIRRSLLQEVLGIRYGECQHGHAACSRLHSACVSIRQARHAACSRLHSARVSIGQHRSAYVRCSRCPQLSRLRDWNLFEVGSRRSVVRHQPLCIRQHTSAYVSIRQHTVAFGSIRQHTSTNV